MKQLLCVLALAAAAVVAQDTNQRTNSFFDDSADGSLIPIPCPDPVCLMELFRHKLIKALLGREKISPHLVEIMQHWVHPGFSVFQGEAIAPDDHEAHRRLLQRPLIPPTRKRGARAIPTAASRSPAPAGARGRG